MKKLLSKVRNKAGETIGETLVALLISSFALVMLAGAISASSGMITKSTDAMQAYYEESNEIVEGSDSGTITLKVNGSTYSENVAVEYGKESKFDVVAFRVIKSAGGSGD
ncbi:MAG: hypothetical protein IJI20_03135 [Firmicutes bacterium]|nr:hypothetical protein [Bacillota bacterium]